MARPKLHRKCSYKDCTMPHRALGLCNMHWMRRKNGRDMDAPPTPKIGERLAWLEENSAYSGDDCLEWPFGYKDNGYGVVHFRGVSMAANRAMTILAHGDQPDPEHYHSAHSCHNRKCVNPRHLRWATAQENAHERRARFSAA